MASSARPIGIAVNPPLWKVRARLAAARDRLKDMRTPYARSAVYLDQWVQRNFRTEGGEVGGWMPLKAGGRTRGKGHSRRFDPSAKILQDTGRLRASFDPFVTGRDAGIGSDLEYAEVHEKGLGPIPQRRMLPKRREVIKDVRAIFRDHVRSALRA